MEKLREVLIRYRSVKLGGVPFQYGLSLNQALSQIHTIILECLPEEFPYNTTSSKEFNEGRFCFNQALTDIKAKLKERMG